jgi:hypothetical protein
MTLWFWLCSVQFMPEQAAQAAFFISAKAELCVIKKLALWGLALVSLALAACARCPRGLAKRHVAQAARNHGGRFYQAPF